MSVAIGASAAGARAYTATARPCPTPCRCSLVIKEQPPRDRVPAARAARVLPDRRRGVWRHCQPRRRNLLAVRTAVGSSAVFSGLLGGCGTYAVTPSDPWYVWGGKY